MVRSAERRIEKYKHNVDGAAVGRAVAALKEIMVDQQRSYFPQISLLEMKVKKIVEAAGIPVQQVAQYINVARKCYHIAKTFSQATRDNEAQRIVDLWTSRGLNGLLTAEVCGLTGCRPTGAAPAVFEWIWKAICPEFFVGDYYPSLLALGGLPKNTQLWAGDVVAIGFPVTRKSRWDNIGMRFWPPTGAAGNIRLAIYDSDGDQMPQNLLLETAVLPIFGAAYINENINITLDAGMYFIAWQCDINTPWTRYNDNCYTIAGTTNFASYAVGQAHSQAFGPYPDPFPLPPDWDDGWVYGEFLRHVENL